jgi:ribosome-binding ATPase YchF (GTP1/OBG family)
MKISLVSLGEVLLGKHNIKDSRLDEVDKITKAKKKTYVQVELVGEEGALEADAILVGKDAATDLILKDLEFVENRLARATQEEEKALLTKFKEALEKEKFVSSITLTAEEEKIISSYSLLTKRPVITATQQDLENIDDLLARVLRESGYSSFFTTGEKETRAWLIRRGATAWEAAGLIHSDIQKGFIRAEIISLEDFLGCKGKAQANQAGKMRLETKDYIMQEGELANFRFNK